MSAYDFTLNGGLLEKHHLEIVELLGLRKLRHLNALLALILQQIPECDMFFLCSVIQNVAIVYVEIVEECGVDVAEIM